MKKNSNKFESKTHPDYLNFIRRNQQIVRQFKEITQVESKGRELKKNFSSLTGQAQTIEVDRYSNNPVSSEKISNHLYFRDVIPTISYSVQEPSPFVSRRNNVDPFKIGIGGHNVRQNELMVSLKRDEGEMKLPKLNSRVSQQIKSPSEASQKLQRSMEKQILQYKSERLANHHQVERSRQKRKKTRESNKQQINLSIDSSKKSESPPSKNKSKSMKFTDVHKTKVNNKLVRTYYDYENILELKEAVFDLLPSFKPIQNKRDPRDLLDLGKNSPELLHYLEANMIHKPVLEVRKVQIVGNKNQKDEKMSKQLQNEEQSEQMKTISTIKMERKSKFPSKKNNLTQALFSNKKSSDQTVYQNKIVSYREFLFLVNFSHRIFDPLILKEDPEFFKADNKYRFYIGKGNNKLLVKSLMKRRFWWVEVDDPKNANFVWTQLKINTYYQFQTKPSLENKYDKLDSEHPYEDKKLQKLRSKQKLETKKSESPQKVSGIVRGKLPENERKIFTNADSLHLKKMMELASEDETGLKNFHRFENRLKFLPENFLTRKDLKGVRDLHLHNHFSCNFEIGNKKALFYNLKHYYEAIGVNPFRTIPLTFHIKKGQQDPEFLKFAREFRRLKNQMKTAEKSNESTKKLSRNVWIIKPGELSNRGNGITVVDEMYEINSIMKKEKKHPNGQDKTFIIQKYIEKPMLYKNRKFDIRHYMMISRLHGRMRAYWFSEGYIRTSCYEYDLEEVGDSMIHLTNDAIQKHCPAYGKYEEGNKLSYAEFQRYLDNTFPDKKYSFINQIYPRMREIGTDAIKSTYLWMDPEETEHNFEIFGLDFMIDSQFQVWLIEVNTNPCLELSSQLLSRIIPTMLENSLRLSLDPLFPPPIHFPNNIKYLAPDNPLERLQYELIFDEGRDGKQLEQIFRKAGKADCGEIDEEDEVYENEGKQIDIGGDLE